MRTFRAEVNGKAECQKIEEKIERVVVYAADKGDDGGQGERGAKEGGEGGACCAKAGKGTIQQIALLGKQGKHHGQHTNVKGNLVRGVHLCVSVEVGKDKRERGGKDRAIAPKHGGANVTRFQTQRKVDGGAKQGERGEQVERGRRGERACFENQKQRGCACRHGGHGGTDKTERGELVRLARNVPIINKEGKCGAHKDPERAKDVKKDHGCGGSLKITDPIHSAEERQRVKHRGQQRERGKRQPKHAAPGRGKTR